MKFRLLFAPLFLALLGLLPAAAQPQPVLKSIQLPDGTSVRVVNREKMRLAKNTKKFTAPKAMPALPTVPDSFDFTTTKDGKTISFPTLGNDQYGDCYYVAPAHMTQGVVGYRTGQQVTFDKTKLINRYLKLSGGDNGLSDQDILPEWKTGIVGPNGPYKLLDYATIDPADFASVKVAMYHCGGILTTHSLRTSWEANIRAGAVWDMGGSIDPNAGHAVHEVGIKNGNMIVNTWGMQVYMTPAGLANSDAEVVVPVCYDWFDPKTGYTPNGVHYDDFAAFWFQATSHKLPADLFPKPGPTPTPTPTPTPGKGFTGTVTYTYSNGATTNVAVSQNTLPAIEPGKPYTIDLSKYGPFVKWRLKHKLLAVIDHDSIVVTDNGDSITISPKAPTLADGKLGAPDWNAFLEFLTKLLPLILQIMAMFGA